MRQSTIDNVKLEQQLNSDTKDDVTTSSPNIGNTMLATGLSSSQKYYSKKEVIEIIKNVLFHNDPKFYEVRGIDTNKRATEAFEKSQRI